VNIVQAAAMVSAYPVIAIDIVDSKLEMARRFGATYCFNSKNVEDLRGEIRNILNNNDPDVVIDTTGNSRVIEQAYEMTHPDGKTILVGVPKKGDNVCIYTLPIHFNKILKGSHGGSCVPHIDIPRYIRLVRADKMTLNGLITHEFSLEQINDAINLMMSGEAGRVLVSMSQL
jgi:S-(hydroxymethyl)glutathione dehydrogenase/alcohol dehydrogenase